MDKLTAIINRAAASYTEYYASQQGIFFEDMVVGIRFILVF